MAVKPIPDGYHAITPYFVVNDAARFIAFLKAAFGAEEQMVTTRQDGTIGHASVRIGDSMAMLGQASDQWKATPASMYLYVVDTDATYRRALEAGATTIMEPADQFYGDRNAGVIDAEGNTWWIATHVEDVSHEEIVRRERERSQQQSASCS